MSSSLAIFSSWCGDQFGCHAQSLGLLSLGLWVTFIIQWNLVSFSVCDAHRDVHELEVVSLILCRMACHLSGKLVTLHLYKSTAKAYFCNQSGTVSFLTLASNVFHLADKHSITLIPVYIKCRSYISITGKVGSKGPSFFLHSSNGISTLGSNGGGFVGILMYQWMSVLLHFGETATCGRLRVECFQPSLEG